MSGLAFVLLMSQDTYEAPSPQERAWIDAAASDAAHRDRRALGDCAWGADYADLPPGNAKLANLSSAVPNHR